MTELVDYMKSLPPETKLSLIGVLISLIALIFSYQSYRNSNIQFLIINQGYLSYSLPVFEWIPPDGYSKSVIDTNTILKGYVFGVKLENVGNIPVKYKPIILDIFLGGKQVCSVKDCNDSGNVLYPKATMTYYGKTIIFDKPTTLGELQKTEIKFNFKFVYTDIGSNKKKYLHRETQIFLYPDGGGMMKLINVFDQ